MHYLPRIMTIACRFVPRDLVNVDSFTMHRELMFVPTMPKVNNTCDVHLCNMFTQAKDLLFPKVIKKSLQISLLLNSHLPSHENK